MLEGNPSSLHTCRRHRHQLSVCVDARRGRDLVALASEEDRLGGLG